MDSPSEPVIDVEATTLSNNDYRWVYQTSAQLQYVFMSLKPGQKIPAEVHPWTTQFIRIEQGQAQVTIGDEQYSASKTDSVFIPAGTRHEIKNVGKVDLKLYTLYAPPVHAPGLIQTHQPLKD